MYYINTYFYSECDKSLDSPNKKLLFNVNINIINILQLFYLI